MIIEKLNTMIAEGQNKRLDITQLLIARELINEYNNIGPSVVDDEYIRKVVESAVYERECIQLDSIGYDLSFEQAKNYMNFSVKWCKGDYLETIQTLFRTLDGEDFNGFSHGDAILIVKLGDISCEVGYFPYEDDVPFADSIALLVESRDKHGDFYDGDFDESFKFNPAWFLQKSKIEKYVFELMMKNAKKRASKLYNKVAYSENMNIKL